MTTEKAGLRVRMYRVGFGDFFLLTVPTEDGPKHILVDCGVTPGTTHNGDVGTIKEAVAHMAKETKHKLALIIVTHRHMDHIIGFSRCADIFKDIEVESIWMPYWESEYEDAVNFQADLTALAMDMQHYLAFSADKNDETKELLGMLRNATGVEDEELFAAAGTPGKGGGTNAKSLAMLKSGFGVKPEYYKKGEKPKLPKSLQDSGLDAVILGPPPPDAMDFMKLNDLKKGVGQYLGADEEGSAPASKIFEPFGKMWRTDATSYPDSAFREYAPRIDNPDPNLPKPHLNLESRIHSAQPAVFLTAVKELEHSLNNQSLVVLFTFKGKKLLFVGDAQAGNWTYWMYGGTPTKTPSLDDLSAEGKSVLGNLDFYKVGHHGSTNATPITAVEAMGGTFVSMCSTQRDTYGNPDKGTEVPRDPLLAALAKKSTVVRSDDVTELYVDCEI